MRELDRQKLRALDALARLQRIEESTELTRMAESRRSEEKAQRRVDELRERRLHLVAVDPVSAQEIKDRRFLDALIEKERRFEAQVKILRERREDQQKRFERSRARTQVTDCLRQRQLDEAAHDESQTENRQSEDSQNWSPRRFRP